MTVTIDYWLLLSGALAGSGAVLLVRGRNRLIKAAVAGAVIVLLVDLARGFL